MRRTAHRYEKGRPVPEEVMERALEAAIMAPNHLMTWPWRFYRVGPEGRAVLASVYVRLKMAGKDANPTIEDRLRDKMMQAPELVVVSQVLAGEPAREREDYAACATAIQNLMLSLAGDGVGSKWSTSGVMHDPESYQLLGIDREQETILGLIWAGYSPAPVTAPERPSWRTYVRSVP